jgi:N-acyl-D-aspartate/D-glutamate deacylase
MHDLLIRAGSIVDGSGAAAFTGDVAIDNGCIVAVGGVDGPAYRTLDADGLLVTPGFVDIHTHYDGQATWDPLLTPSCWHGVTTAVMGNCGVGFAPMQPGRREFLIELMEGVEDIPGSVLAEGVDWGWESFRARPARQGAPSDADGEGLYRHHRVRGSRHRPRSTHWRAARPPAARRADRSQNAAVRVGAD